MQAKLDQEKQKESLLGWLGKSNGPQTLEQESENLAKLRSDTLRSSTSEPSSSKEPGSEGIFLCPYPVVHVCLTSFSVHSGNCALYQKLTFIIATLSATYSTSKSLKC